MSLLKIAELHPHPKNDYYFDDIKGDGWDDLLKSIRTSGVTNAISVTQNNVIISGHQRVRACQLLGIEEIPAHIINYTDDELERQKDVKDLIESNLKQRVPGNSNPVKLGRCFAFLEEYYGVKEGRPKKKLPNNSAVSKTQKELAEESGMSVDTMRNYKRLASAIPEIQELVETGKVSPTTALSILRQLPESEQKKLALAVSGTEEKITNRQVQELINRLQTTERQLAEKDKKISELENREPEIKTVKVIPDDYEMYKNGYKRIVDERQKAVKELSETRKILDQMKKSTPESKLVDDAKEQMAYFTIATYKYLKNYGGFTWAFDKWPDVPESTKRDFRRAIETLAGFSQQMMKNLEVLDEQ